MLDDDDRVARVDQAVEHLQELLHVGEMEAGGGLVEDVEGAAGGPPRELGGQLDALGLAARQGGRRLAEMDVAQPHVVQRLELGADGGHGLEEVERLGDRHLQDVGDRAAAVEDLQRLPVVALAAAHLARHVHVRQELHLDLDDAVALARLAAAALDVEAEAAALVAPQAGVGGAGEEVADGPEHAGVGGRVGARRAADRALVDLDDLVDGVQPLDPVVGAGILPRAEEGLGQGPVQDVGDERALARAGDAGHGGEGAQREAHVEVAAGCWPAPRPPRAPGRCRSGGAPGWARCGRRAGRRR